MERFCIPGVQLSRAMNPWKTLARECCASGSPPGSARSRDDVRVLKFRGSRATCGSGDPQPCASGTSESPEPAAPSLPKAAQLLVSSSAIEPGFGSSLWALPAQLCPQQGSLQLLTALNEPGQKGINPGNAWSWLHAGAVLGYPRPGDSWTRPWAATQPEVEVQDARAGRPEQLQSALLPGAQPPGHHGSTARPCPTPSLPLPLHFGAHIL